MTPAASASWPRLVLLAPLSCRDARWWQVVAPTRKRSGEASEPMVVIHWTRAKAQSTPTVEVGPQTDFAALRALGSTASSTNQEDAATRSAMAQRFRNPSIGCTESACKRSAPSEKLCLWFSDAQCVASRVVQKSPRCGLGFAKLKNRATLRTADCVCEKTRSYTGAFLDFRRM